MSGRLSRDRTAAIAIDALVVDRGDRTVLHGVTCEVAAGAVTGLLGPSGCGKTTMMRSIVGVQIVRSGTVGVLGEPAGSPRLRQRVGYVDAGALGLLATSVSARTCTTSAACSASRRRAWRRCIDTVSLGSSAGRVICTLSGGERARVSLARAMLGEPEVLVLDEPTVGLDPVLRRDLWQQFSGWLRSGVTLLISSHVMDEAARCESLLLMRDGGLLAADHARRAAPATGRENLEDAFLALIERRERS